MPVISGRWDSICPTRVDNVVILPPCNKMKIIQNSWKINKYGSLAINLEQRSMLQNKKLLPLNLQMHYWNDSKCVL
jgi:hypothetical protein